MKRIVLVTIAATLLCVGMIGVAGADTHQSSDTDWEQDETTVDGTQSSTTDNDSSVQQGSTTSGDTQVAVTAAPTGETYGSNDTINVFAGVLNTSGEFAAPIAGENATIEITSPNGTVETYNVTTDDNGTVTAAYDLTDRPDGFYDISVTHDTTGTTTSIGVRAGVILESTTRSGVEHVKDPTTIAFLARNGEFPEQGVNVSLTVEKNGTVVANTTDTTDNNGFVDITFTPNETGEYDITAETTDGDSLRDAQRLTVSDLALRSNFRANDLTEGMNASFYGQVLSESGAKANTDLNIVLTNSAEEPVVNLSTTTGPAGFFAVDYTVPNGVEQLNPTITTADGQPVATDVWLNHLDVDSAPTPDDGAGGTPTDFVDLSVTIDDYGTGVDDFRSSTVPGGEVTFTITANENDTAIANEEVDVVLRHGSAFDPGAPIFSGTTQTNSSGAVQTTLPIPENTPDDTRVGGEVVLEYKNETYTERFSIGVERYTIDFDTEGGTVTVNAIDRLTGDPAEGIPLLYDEQYTNSRTGSYAYGGVETNASGSAAQSFTLPADIGFIEFNNYVTRYDSTNLYRHVDPKHPGTVTVPDSVSPGEEVSVGFDAPNTAYGIVFGNARSPERTYASKLYTEQNTTVTVPETVAPGDFIPFIVWASDENGTLYKDEQRVEVTEAPETAAAFDVSSQEALTGENLTFDASASTSAAGDLSYEWDFGDGTNATGVTPTHSYDTAGEYEVTLTVTDGDNTSNTANRTVTVNSSIEVAGTFQQFDGNPAANDTVAVFTDSQSTRIESTNATGAFSILLPERTDPFDIQYYQGDIERSSIDKNAFPKDGNVDIYATEVAGDEDTDLGTVQLPQGFNVNVSVVDESGAPVENASVGFGDQEDGTNATAGWRTMTNANGLGETDTNHGPGLELNGSADIEVRPPVDQDRFVNRTYQRNLTVTSPTEIEIQLAESKAVADFSVAPSDPTVNETVTFDASSSFAEAEIQNYTWTFGDGTTINTTNATVNHTYETAGNYSVSLTVEDANGNTDTATQEVTVEESELSAGDGAGFGAIVAVLAVMATLLAVRRD